MSTGRYLADENFPRAVIDALRERGHDVLSAAESMRGANDAEVLARGQSEERVLLTLDKDFGRLAFLLDQPARSGLVLFRLTGSSAEADNIRMLAALEAQVDWRGQFAVVTDEHVRRRSFPPEAAAGADAATPRRTG